MYHYHRSLTKQLTRYAKVGGVVGKLATKLASQRYLGVKLDKEKHASEIRAALGSIKGPLMKVAQLSATIPDLLPDEYAQELMHLQSNAPPMGWLFVCLLYTSPSPRDATLSRMPSSA